jgi:hypothetical protein
VVPGAWAALDEQAVLGGWVDLEVPVVVRREEVVQLVVEDERELGHTVTLGPGSMGMEEPCSLAE